MKIKFYLLLIAPIIACSTAYGQITAFSFTSSADSIFQGQSGFASLATGFRFILNSIPGNGIDLQIQGPNYPDAPWYTLDLAAPQHALLSPGTYTGAERYPFQDVNEPGLSFFGNFVG